MGRSLLATMFWPACVLGVVAVLWSAGSAASFILGAQLARHPATAHDWHDALRFGLAAPLLLAWLQLAASIGALRNDTGRADG